MVALGSALLFGLSTPLAKNLVGSVPPLALAGLLYVGSGLGLTIILAGRRIWRPGEHSISLPQRGEWLWLAGAVLFGGVAGPVALMYGLVSSAASTASLLLNLEAVFTALLAWFLFRENFDRRIALGMLAIVAGGSALAWTPGARGEASAGLALIAVACLCWAIDNNLTRKVSANDAVLIACVKGLVAGSVNTALALSTGAQMPPAVSLVATLVVGFLGYGLSLALFVVALRGLGTARTGAYFAVAPLFGVGTALAIWPEAPSPAFWAAAALMAFGVWLHLRERHAHGHTHDATEHAHWHRHDAHHRHVHDFAWDGVEPHAHPHRHAVLTHAHAHYPDIHHRHRH